MNKWLEFGGMVTPRCVLDKLSDYRNTYRLGHVKRLLMIRYRHLRPSSNGTTAFDFPLSRPVAPRQKEKDGSIVGT